MPQEWETETASAEETQRVGRLLGELCAGGEVLLLTGGLGSGKTCFVQGLAYGLGVHEYVHSPTFVMVNEYRGRLTLYHMDLYRVTSVAETIDLGLEDYLRSNAVCAIEWADQALAAFPAQHLLLRFTDLGGDRRGLRLESAGARHDALLQRLSAAAVQAS
ncbi:MAG: tRNA (adenosine(37)-N6)-threonylcarbamoyltransferase complex ATPase subunit type 1 TsaE [Dehalococcoidia bacterium]|nr:tRNA (adenosine(37)-N6)-threonylcarbamoyltransferase complex ATPase subunit type 1 TsaE [Dehalococcoidia bacterium]